MSTLNNIASEWIIDCDPGCDDAIALALAAEHLKHESVKVLTVAGNVGVDLTSWNACRVLAACSTQWPVHRGCARSLSGVATPATSVHGRDGLGDVPNDVLKGGLCAPSKTTAVEELLALSRDSKTRRFRLICTGPLTNLATALNLMTAKEQLEFWGRCDDCVVMGGAFDVPGNITAAAEFNMHFDPVAAHIVLESWRVSMESEVISSLRPIKFVPLDVTETVGITLPLPKSGDNPTKWPPRSAFLRAVLNKYGLFHSWFCARPRNEPGDLSSSPIPGIERFDEWPFLEARMRGANGLKELKPFCFLHDPLAVWLALGLGGKKDLVKVLTWKRRHISVDIAHGDSRGRLLYHREKSSTDNPSRIPTLGTEVEWMTPDAFRQHREDFIREVRDLLAV